MMLYFMRLESEPRFTLEHENCWTTALGRRGGDRGWRYRGVAGEPGEGFSRLFRSGSLGARRWNSTGREIHTTCALFRIPSVDFSMQSQKGLSHRVRPTHDLRNQLLIIRAEKKKGSYSSPGSTSDSCTAQDSGSHRRQGIALYSPF